MSMFHRHRLLCFGLLFIALSVIGFYAVYAQVADRHFAWDARLLSAPFLLSCLLLLVVYFTADGLRLWFTLRALKQYLPFGPTARLVFLNIFVSHVTPLATGGGVAQVWFLQRRGVPVGTAMTATVIRTVLAVLFIFGATPLLVLTIPGAEASARQTHLVSTLVACVVLYIGFFSVVIWQHRWLVRPLLALLRWARRLHLIGAPRQRRWGRRLVRETRRFAIGIRLYFRGEWYDILGSVLTTAIFLLALFSFPALLCHALGYDLDYWLVVGRMVITTFVMYFSPTPGASGIAESVFARLFVGSLTAGHLVLVTIAWRFLTIYVGMAIGLLVTHREMIKRPPVTEHASQ